MTTFFLHGLESSSNGTKGKFFKKRFGDMIIPDFTGDLQSRLNQLERVCQEHDELVLVGSSFGGLMATCFAIANPDKVKKLLLMAPALNFPGFSTPPNQLEIPTYLLIGKKDDVTPAAKVIPLAEKTFSNLQLHLVDEDHMLHQAFTQLDWDSLLTTT